MNRASLLTGLLLLPFTAVGEEPVPPTGPTDPPPQLAAVAGPAGGSQQLELEAAAIRGNQELPKVLYIVPWKDPAMVELTGRPVNSLVEEVLAPVDREVFRRQTRYFGQLYGPAGDNDEKAPSRGRP